MTQQLDAIRFPVGPFTIDPHVTPEKRNAWIDQIAEAPALLRLALAGLTDAQLDTRYREDGWTIRQVVHHIADADINGFMRFKLALTEDNPSIKTYEEDGWAETVDGRDAPVELSLQLFEALRARWALLLRSLSEADFARAFVHPDRGVMTIDRTIQLYAWHGRHHTAHITDLRRRAGW